MPLPLPTAEPLLIGASALLAAASLPRGLAALRAVRGVTVLIGVVGLWWAIDRHRGLIAGLAFGGLACVNLLQLALALPRRGIVRLSAEEAAMAARFPGLPRAAFRDFLGQGLWIHGRAGEPLITEGVPVTHLFYLSQGEAVIASGGRHVATSGPGHFFGELDLFARTPAIATVTLASDARFWCVAVDALKGFLAANANFHAPLESALAGELRDKLRQRISDLPGRTKA